ncbi:unnamed protein product [Onchocerca flexuosa]|uniref:Uncharacterized protein n=1 Tax=Onchocerca flexuosa TaxID=387005 RepID=A0A183HEN3_9BILA|nr:unnamed protein product [Onchocerca flexuosa]
MRQTLMIKHTFNFEQHCRIDDGFFSVFVNADGRYPEQGQIPLTNAKCQGFTRITVNGMSKNSRGRESKEKLKLKGAESNERNDEEKSFREVALHIEVKAVTVEHTGESPHFLVTLSPLKLGRRFRFRLYSDFTIVCGA